MYIIKIKELKKKNYLIKKYIEVIKKEIKKS